MKYLLLIPVALLFSCRDAALSDVPVQVELVEPIETPVQTSQSRAQELLLNGVLDVVEIDSCEYIIYDGYREGNIIHKANCKNHK